MTSDLVLSIGMICFGGLLGIHCPRAAWKEWRAGIAEDGFGHYTRHDQPFQFWVTIGETFAAGLLGLIFMAVGIGMILVTSSTDL